MRLEVGEYTEEGIGSLLWFNEVTSKSQRHKENFIRGDAVEFILIGLLVGGAVAGIVSLPARIPVLRRNAQDSKTFRYGLIILLGGVMFLITLLFLAAMLIGVSIGVYMFYDGIHTNTGISEEARWTYQNEYWKLWRELSLRLLVPFSYNHCFHNQPDSYVCTMVSDHTGIGIAVQPFVWGISLFLGVITGWFAAYHTRSHRKEKKDR